MGEKDTRKDVREEWARGVAGGRRHQDGIGTGSGILTMKLADPACWRRKPWCGREHVESVTC